MPFTVAMWVKKTSDELRDMGLFESSDGQMHDNIYIYNYKWKLGYEFYND